MIRLPRCYPVYFSGYREALAPMDAAVETGAGGDGPMEAGSEMGPRDGGPDLQDDARTDALRDEMSVGAMSKSTSVPERRQPSSALW